MSRTSVIAKAADYFDHGQFQDELARRVALRTESQKAGTQDELRSYLSTEMQPGFEAMGFTCRLFDNPVAGAGALLFAERLEDEGLTTVLTYGHGDVIRGLEEQWRDGLSPWQLVAEGDRLYGRGTADNKGQHTINMAALRTVLAVRGKLGFNCKVLLETGEEMGSPGLKQFCEEHQKLLSADVLIASDGPRVAAQSPTVFLGSRGALNFDLSVDLRAGAHHSGNWGGVLANPGVILAHALASITSARGKILIREWMPEGLPDNVRATLAGVALAQTPDSPEIDQDWGEPGLTPAEKIYGWTSFEVLSFKTGNPENPVNAIPPKAIAACQIRFVVGVDAQDLLPALRRHLERNHFPMVKVERWKKGYFNATRLDPDNPWVRRVTQSLQLTSGKPTVVLPNLGGSLPNEIFADVLGLPTVWVPHSYPACSQHAPNEHVLGSASREALQMMAGLFWDLGDGAAAQSAAGVAA